MDELRDVFALFANKGLHGTHHGTLSTKDLGTVIRSLDQNPSEAEIQDWAKEVDPDGTGSIGFDEFVNLMSKIYKNTDTEEEILEAFKVFDRDGNGLIDAAELKYVLTNLGEKLMDEEVDEMFEKVDLNGDGMISYKEFAYTMMITGGGGFIGL